MSKLRVGMGNSYGLRIVVLANADFLPLSVTAGVIKITKPTAVAGVTTTVDWTATLSAIERLGHRHVHVQRERPRPRLCRSVARVDSVDRAGPDTGPSNRSHRFHRRTDDHRLRSQHVSVQCI